VPVAVGLPSALDRNVGRDRVRALVRLARVLERDARALLRLPDDGDRDPDRAALPEPGAEVGVHVVVRPDRGDHRGGVRRDGQPVDPLVPGVGGGEDGAAGRGRQRRRRSRGGGARDERQHGDGDDSGHGFQDAAGAGLLPSGCPQPSHPARADAAVVFHRRLVGRGRKGQAFAARSCALYARFAAW
jgi:hypothetical protein